MSKKEDAVEALGVVTGAERNGFYVQLNDASHVVFCHLGGKVRKNYIRIVPGDKVRVELSPYDLTKGRIVFREK